MSRRRPRPRSPAFSAAKRARLSRNYFVPLFLLGSIGIFEDEDDDEHEEESPISEFRFSLAAHTSWKLSQPFSRWDISSKPALFDR